MIKGSLYILLISLFFLSCKEESKLPVWGQKEFIEGIDTDTIYHTLSYWNFTNQDGELISKGDYEGKVYVANFFFTRCPGICPVLTKNLRQVQAETKGLNVSFLSHTVDPKNDTVGRLKWYCEDKQLDNSNWDFVTGEQKAIYEMGVLSYLVPNSENALAPGGFLHSDKFILIDTKSRIRGMYSGTDSTEVNKLIIDINKLLVEDE
jgi:protein SCO1